MQISGGSAYYAGLSAVQNGLARVDQAASQIASNSVDRPAVSNQSTNLQAQQVLSVDRSQQDLAGSAVELTQGKLQVEAGLKVTHAANETLGTLIDTYA
ncbi:pyrroloquinoline quinone biosynthesis protein PqqE [Pseudomonas silvicola]|uniref:pyrroloquinoline quinone biosynthesis protein PqqE n=1 Tax=Pseudomonas sp. RIT-To-2 TaxID=3462541 RepID=UPI00227A04A7|nr:pyrroloquinoline quinone biosynthesis protein PqqE [Pseudomonas silvicola]